MTCAALFTRPDALPWLLLAPAVWLALHVADRVRRQRVARLVGPRAAYVAAERSGRRRAVRRIVFSAAVLLALIALLGPMLGEPEHDVEWRGVDLVVCLDVSRSMLAQDLAPDRLERAKQEIHALASRAEGDRLALVVFAGEARPLVPLTRDAATFVGLADLVDPTSVTVGGTDLGLALDAALGVLSESASEHSVVVLLTDGEDLGGRGLRAAETCARRGVVVHTVGLGSRLGSKIALAGGGGETFLTDRSGADVVSALDAPGLRRIAERTGGRYVDAGTAADPLVELYEERIAAMARATFETADRKRTTNRFQWPLLLAFGLWMLAFGLTDRSRA